MWIVTAVFSAFFAGITAIFAKCGIRKTDSDIATALRTLVVLVFSWMIVFLEGSQKSIGFIGTRAFLFLILSGLATGASWLCYFKALSLGDVNKVAPIDKSSTILTVIIAIVCFSETTHLIAKIAGTVLLAAGIYLMEDKKGVSSRKESDAKWFIYAVFSAVFAALTSILAKIGIAGVESNLGTAIRTVVVLVMAWGVVFAKGKQYKIKKMDLHEAIFIGLSGLSTGISWLCYYYAIQNGIVSVVVPIDKMSILFTILFSMFFLGERVSRKSGIGLGMMLLGTLIMALFM